MKRIEDAAPNAASGHATTALKLMRFHTIRGKSASSSTRCASHWPGPRGRETEIPKSELLFRLLSGNENSVRGRVT